MATASIRTLLAGLVDYAGLFPPAKLGMQPCVENYARALAGDHAWMLGRFICPASRLAEFSGCAAMLMPGTAGTSGYRERAAGDPWRVSVLIDGPLDADLPRIARFNEHHAEADHGQAIADAVELRPMDAPAVERALDQIPDEYFPFFEVPSQGDFRGIIAALAGSMAAAKIRTGGTTPESFPEVERVAQFLVACAASDVPLKATAGLHHPVRGPFRLTYEADSPRTVMHGFLNVFLAGAFVRQRRLGEAQAAAILGETDGRAFRFTEEGVRWREHILDTIAIAQAREHFAMSFGSCSFDEPVEDLRAMGLV